MQLVITEKPSVAKSISSVIGAAEKKNGYMEGNGFLVSWCVGHLVEPVRPENYGEKWKKWTYESLPMLPEEWKYEAKTGTKAQYDVLCRLMNRKDVSAVVCATDAGREGELIFRLVYEAAGCGKPVKRLWISSMEEGAIKEGFENLRPGSDYDNLYHSALCRQRADWLVGLNCTRLFTVLYGGRVLKVGRVQTPTLAMIVEREETIKNFKKEPYHLAHILADGIDAVTEKIRDREFADNIAQACKGAQAHITSVTREKKTVQPPKLYDLTTLQRDANRLFGYSAKQTLEYAQSLYEKKLLTYPRTDSRYLSDDMAHTAESVIRAVYRAKLLEEMPIYSPDTGRILDSRKVTDHHAIIPTEQTAGGMVKELPETERRLLMLVAERLLCATGTVHIYETVKAELSCEKYCFQATGKYVLNNGWKEIEKLSRRAISIKEEAEEEERELPELMEGQTLLNVQTKVSGHSTTPPQRFTEDLLLAAMERAGAEEMNDEAERKGLGTPATRADIIEKLVGDGFVKREKKLLVPTEDGIKLITVLPDAVKSPELTAEWENALTLVAKGEYPAEKFMAGIKAMIMDLVKMYHEVGEEDKNMFGSEEAIGKCPKCGGDVIKGKFGCYCSEKCGMNLGKAFGRELTEEQLRDLLEGKKILLKGLKSKKGTTYAAYLVPDGVEPYSYIKKDGTETGAFRFKFTLEFPEKEKK